MMQNEQKRNNIKRGNNGDRDRTSSSRDIDANPLTDYPFYLIENVEDRKLKILLKVMGCLERII
jgi:hypothetical protein